MTGIDISLDNIGKKFGKEWIFRNVDLKISSGEKIVILGGNGSGKSTLLQIISGYVSPSEGTLKFSNGKEEITGEKSIFSISFASPYLQLVDDLTARELVEHIGEFKPFVNKLKAEKVLQIAKLDQASNKFIRQFSSGMKQRLKLALAFLSDTSVLLLDEPVSNLDREAIEWYKQMVNNYTKDRTVIVCSNAIDEEYYFCTKKINVQDHKPAILKRD
jgi:ABC-type multidrug transport system ATPase subunit